MRWGRKEKRPAAPTADPAPAARAAAVLGALAVSVFLIAAAGQSDAPSPVVSDADGVIAALYAEHAGLVSFLGIDEYFPPRAVAVSTLPAEEETEARTFASYLYESLRAVFAGS
jgi:hypothetical protein